MTHFRAGAIAGLVWRPLQFYRDSRGWLCEIFRQDALPSEFHPAMTYISATLPGVTRGPHEHREQADCFGFFDPNPFRLLLWDNRPQSATFGCFEERTVGGDFPMLVVVPAGVVHAYQNIGAEAGMVLNCPNRLYKGPGKLDPIDEIRHEEDPNSPFQVGERRA